MRRESIVINIKMNSSQYEKNKDDIYLLTQNDFPIIESDTLNIDWDFCIEYLGNIDMKLDALLRIAKSPGIINVNMEETKYGEVLIEQVLRKIRLLMSRSC